MVELTTDTSGAIWQPNFWLMQVEPPGGQQIHNKCKWKVMNATALVYYASGDVFCKLLKFFICIISQNYLWIIFSEAENMRIVDLLICFHAWWIAAMKAFLVSGMASQKVWRQIMNQYLYQNTVNCIVKTEPHLRKCKAKCKNPIMIFWVFRCWAANW